MTDPQASQFFASLVAAAWVDGKLTEDERAILRRKAGLLGISFRDMDDMISRGKQGQLSLAIPASGPERTNFLQSLIEVVCADGRVEASEYHLLAKVAGQLKVSLPDLRQKIKACMDRRGTPPPRSESSTRLNRPTPFPPSEAPVPLAAPSAPPIIGPASAPPAPPSTLSSPPGPVRLDAPRLVDPVVADLPPVTLQLIKQSLSFDLTEHTLQSMERMLAVPRERAEQILEAVLAAFPDLRASRRAAEPRSSR